MQRFLFGFRDSLWGVGADDFRGCVWEEERADGQGEQESRGQRCLKCHGAHVRHLRPISVGNNVCGHLPRSCHEVTGDEGKDSYGSTKGRVIPGPEPSRCA